ncbi:SGNH/GDSL hydrolase family protein [Streptomyces malaysiensis]|uniref:hypothetical protein n=1 Tax=Streptomyces malaysiensis TaxID=92644 RepID=UPI003715CE91
MSTITPPEREEVPGPSGLTMRECRAHIRRAVTLLRDHGDTRLHHLHGPDVFGPACTRLMLEPEGSDRLHPAAAGHPVLASRFTTLLRRAGCVPMPVALCPPSDGAQSHRTAVRAFSSPLLRGTGGSPSSSAARS